MTQPMVARLKQWARTIKRDGIALWLAARDARVPWLAKAVAAAVAAYALSPIDLIPDFIPVLGYLDDVILVPLGILLAADDPRRHADLRANECARQPLSAPAGRGRGDLDCRRGADRIPPVAAPLTATPLSLAAIAATFAFRSV